MRLFNSGLLAAIVFFSPICLAQEVAKNFGDWVALLQQNGVVINYSSALISPNTRLNAAAIEPTIENLDAQLAVMGLRLRQLNKHIWLVEQNPEFIAPAIVGKIDPKPTQPQPVVLSEIVVSASQYDLVKSSLNQASVLGAQFMANMPSIGDDKLQAVNFLPGNTTNGISAKPQVRGGLADEVLILLDGIPLAEPFHFKDFQSLFSVVDSDIIDRATFHSGGFQVNFGSRLSGVLDIDTLALPGAPSTTLSASLFNSGIKHLGQSENGKHSWLLSFRRSNLDLIAKYAKNDIGKPLYYDSFARYKYALDNGDNLYLSALAFNDDISLKRSNAEEQAQSTYGNIYLSLDYEAKDWQGWLVHNRVNYAKSKTLRSGNVEKSDILTAQLRDRRRFNKLRLSQDWFASDMWQGNVRWGWELETGEASYDYQRSGDYADEFIAISPQRADLNLSSQLSPEGNQGGVYLSWRSALTDSLLVELGSRWDWQDYDDFSHDTQFSPRFNLRYDLGETSYRLGLGYYSQHQSLHELQIEDGVDKFQPAQRSKQLVLGVTHPFGNGHQLRLEAYFKDVDNQRPYFDNALNAVELLPEVLPDRQFIDSDEGHAQGVEISLQYALSPNQELWFNYSYAKTEDKLDGDFVKRRFDRRHNFNVGLNGIWQQWSWQLVGYFRSGVPITAVSLVNQKGQQTLAFGPRNANKLKNYLSMNLQAQRQWPWYQGQLSLTIELINLLNSDNEVGQELDIEDDFSDQFSLKTTTKTGLGITPNIALKYTF